MKKNNKFFKKIRADINEIKIKENVENENCFYVKSSKIYTMITRLTKKKKKEVISH